MNSIRAVIWLHLLAILLLALTACEDNPNNPIITPTQAEPQPVSTNQKQIPVAIPYPLKLLPAANEQNFVATGDLNEIKKRGKFRILTLQQPLAVPYLPGREFPIDHELDLLQTFALQLGLHPMLIYLEHPGQLIQALQDGHGDVIAANFIITRERRRQLRFAAPMTYVREQLVGPVGSVITEAKDIQKGSTVAVRKSSAYLRSLKRLARGYPAIDIVEVDDHWTDKQLLKAVEANQFTFTVASSNYLASLDPRTNTLKPLFDIANSPRSVAWGLRKEAKELQEALNQFLGEQQLIPETRLVDKGDLQSIIDRGVLRVLTRNNASTYFLHRGELVGFEYELAEAFAESLGVELEMIVPPSRSELLPWLIEGRGDIIAAAMTITELRKTLDIAYSDPYHTVTEQLVGRTDEEAPATPMYLAGRSIAVRPSSSYMETISRFLSAEIPITVEAAPEDMETEEIIAKVAAGEYDLTITDSHILDIELTWRNDIKALATLTEGVQHGWMVRKDSTELLEAINGYFAQMLPSKTFSNLYTRYFRDKKRIRKQLKRRTDNSDDNQLSPYDELVRDAAAEFGFDWRLIVSQMYQESRFNPKAKSWVGAQGLMQVMPKTGREFGFKNLADPKSGIRAGVTYLDWLRHRFDEHLSNDERTWFALAAYNAGIGHVYDAQVLAEKLGHDPNVWFDNVDEAMLLLSQKQYYKQAKHGYARGREPYNYVREIRNRYKGYLAISEPEPELESPTAPEEQAKTSADSTQLVLEASD